jgi:hypothetical protein
MKASSFTDPFRYYIPPNREAIKSAMTSGLVVLDTNVLLSPYRFAPAARMELLSVLNRVKDRLWVPRRVAEEFHRNRLNVISDHDAAYMPVIDALRENQKSINEDLEPKIKQLANRTALSDEDRNNLLDLITKSTEAARSAAERLRTDHGLARSLDEDSILEQLQDLLEGKTGRPFTDEEREAAIAEAARRTENRIPPGFLDANKSEPFGDYFVWRQTIAEAADKKIDSLVFVTVDNKEDWYQIIKGKTIGARPELVKELSDQTNTQLVMFNVSSFLFHANEYLDAKVSDATLRQSEALPSVGHAILDKSARHNARAREKLSDVDRLLSRVEAKAALARALEQVINDRLAREQGQDLSFETIALQQQLTQAYVSGKILSRRLLRLQPDLLTYAAVEFLGSGKGEDASDEDTEQVQLELDED